MDINKMKYKRLENSKKEYISFKEVYYPIRKKSDSNFLGDAIYIHGCFNDIKTEREFLNLEETEFPIIFNGINYLNTFSEFLEYKKTEPIRVFERYGIVLKSEDFSYYRLHILQPGEAEAFYESSMSLVINGHEWDTFYDGTHAVPPLPFQVPGYIHKGWYTFSERIDYVPAEQSIVFPLLYDENRRCSFTFVSKACIDKAILYKRFKNPATIGTKESRTAFTGKVETLELDFKNIDEAVLQEFISHGVIRPLDKPLDETEIAQQIAHARAESVKSQKEYLEWLKNQH